MKEGVSVSMMEHGSRLFGFKHEGFSGGSRGGMKVGGLKDP